MAAGGAAVMLCTIPLGTLADQTRHKRRPIALSVVLMALGCGAVFLWSEGRAVGLSKTVQGQPSCRPCCGHKPGDGGAGKARSRSGHMRYEIIATTPSPLPWERGMASPASFSFWPSWAGSPFWAWSASTRPTLIMSQYADSTFPVPMKAGAGYPAPPKGFSRIRHCRRWRCPSFSFTSATRPCCPCWGNRPYTAGDLI